MNALQDEDERTVFQPSATPARLPGDQDFGHGAWRGELPVGVLLNNIYEVRRFLARGGMGEVYEGFNVNTDERVAIKVMLPHLAADPKVQAMFRKEARILTELAHPALVRYRVLAHEPRLEIFYIVTEFIDGQSLSERLGELQTSTTELVALIRRLAEGLAAAHALGAVHRDMSPDNVLLPQGRLDLAKIIDFGMARETNLAHQTVIGDGFAGKLGYVAPEQFGDFGRRIGAWTDVYSLGLVGVAVAARHAPDMGVTLVDAVDRRREGVDLSPLPPSLRPVFQKMLAPDPTDRFQTMAEVIEALDALGRADAAPAEPEPPPPAVLDHRPEPAIAVPLPSLPESPLALAEDPPARSRSLKPWLIGLGVLVALMGAGLGLVFVPGPRKPPPTQAVVAISNIPEAKAIVETAPSPDPAATAAPPTTESAPLPAKVPPPATAAPVFKVTAPPAPLRVAPPVPPVAALPAIVAAPAPAADAAKGARADAAVPVADAKTADAKIDACWRAVDSSWSYLGYATSASCAAQVFSSCQTIHGRWGKTQFRRYDGKLEAKGTGLLAGWRTIGASQCSAPASGAAQ